ncbi:hypothetical protein BH11PLA1_BH11PLA1_24080 [soil metagenome]
MRLLRTILGDPDPRSVAEVRRDVAEELALHQDLLRADLRAQGRTTEEAAAEATRRFGDAAKYQRICTRIITWERLMLQRINLGLLIAMMVAVALLTWQGYAGQRRVEAAVAELTAAVREQRTASTTNPAAAAVAASIAKPKPDANGRVAEMTFAPELLKDPSRVASALIADFERRAMELGFTEVERRAKLSLVVGAVERPGIFDVSAIPRNPDESPGEALLRAAGGKHVRGVFESQRDPSTQAMTMNFFPATDYIRNLIDVSSDTLCVITDRPGLSSDSQWYVYFDGAWMGAEFVGTREAADFRYVSGISPAPPDPGTQRQRVQVKLVNGRTTFTTLKRDEAMRPVRVSDVAALPEFRNRAHQALTIRIYDSEAPQTRKELAKFAKEELAARGDTELKPGSLVTVSLTEYDESASAPVTPTLTPTKRVPDATGLITPVTIPEAALHNLTNVSGEIFDEFKRAAQEAGYNFSERASDLILVTGDVPRPGLYKLGASPQFDKITPTGAAMLAAGVEGAAACSVISPDPQKPQELQNSEQNTVYLLTTSKTNCVIVATRGPATTERQANTTTGVFAATPEGWRSISGAGTRAAAVLTYEASFPFKIDFSNGLPFHPDRVTIFPEEHFPTAWDFKFGSAPPPPLSLRDALIKSLGDGSDPPQFSPMNGRPQVTVYRQLSGATPIFQQELSDLAAASAIDLELKPGDIVTVKDYPRKNQIRWEELRGHSLESFPAEESSTAISKRLKQESLNYDILEVTISRLQNDGTRKQVAVPLPDVMESADTPSVTAWPIRPQDVIRIRSKWRPPKDWPKPAGTP